MKKFLLAVAVLVLSSAVFAQGKPETSISETVTVTDQIGNKVSINGPVERIVSGYYISTSACIAMRLEDKLVAIEAQAQQRPVYSLYAPQLIEIPNIGTAKSFNLEACLAADPDLVILPAKQKDTAKTLNDMGIPAIVVNPENHSQIQQMFELIGKSTSHEQEAEKLISSYKSLLDKAKSITSEIPEKERKTVYMGGVGNYLTTAPKDMYQSSLIEMGGGINCAGNLSGSSWTEVSYEQILSMNPDVIIIPTNSNANGTPDYSADLIMKDRQLSEINAVKTGSIYQMPVGYEAWDSPVPSGALGTLWIISVLYPDRYSSSEFEKEVKNFYTTFYE